MSSRTHRCICWAGERTDRSASPSICCERRPSVLACATALNVGGEGTNSPQAVVPAQVFAPSGLSATAVSVNQVALVWNAFTNADSYNVKRSLVSGGPYTTLVNVTVT